MDISKVFDLNILFSERMIEKYACWRKCVCVFRLCMCDTMLKVGRVYWRGGGIHFWVVGQLNMQNNFYRTQRLRSLKSFFFMPPSQSHVKPLILIYFDSCKVSETENKRPYFKSFFILLY